MDSINQEVEQMIKKIQSEKVLNLESVKLSRSELKRSKIYNKISFIREMLLTSQGFKSSEGLEIHYLIDDPNLREQLTYKLMNYINQYLEC